MASTTDNDVRRVRRWLRLAGSLSLLAGLVCLLLVATGLFSSATRALGLVIGIGLVVYGIVAWTTVVGPGSVER